MSYTILPLEEKHLEDAARLFGRGYSALRAQIPLLPEKYARVDVLLPMLADILQAGGGMAAVDNDRLVGFFSGYRLLEFLGTPAAFSPEWANAAELADSRRIYEQLYTAQAANWVREGFPCHLVSMLPNDPSGLQSWHWLGFGMVAADGLRSLETVPAPDAGIDIHPADPSDVEALLALDNALKQHLSGSPTYFPHKGHSREYFINQLQDPEYVYWIARQDDEPVAYMGFGPASDQACTIIVDDGTTSIPGAFTAPHARRTGIASALLNCGLEWARQTSYQRSAVDFEPTNPLAAHFWLHHYELVCVTLMRQIKSGISQENE